MMRNLYWMATALAVAVIAPLGPSARAQHEHDQQFRKCAKTCADCQLECDACFEHCLTLLSDGKKEHAKTAQLCADCAECCKTCSALCARQGPSLDICWSAARSAAPSAPRLAGSTRMTST